MEEPWARSRAQSKVASGATHRKNEQTPNTPDNRSSSSGSSASTDDFHRMRENMLVHSVHVSLCFDRGELL